jgi:hypothetical protein
MRLYTPTEFAELFRRADLEVVRMFGSFAGEEYTRGSRRLIVLGRKTAHRRPKARVEAEPTGAEPVPLRDE